jgi:Holliday junction DNA helicase RuvB
MGFCTCNNKERLLTLFYPRFMIFHLKPYNRSKFIEISNKILVNNGSNHDLANTISESVWNKLKSRDIRDSVKIAKLAKTKEDILMITKTLHEYSK